MSFTMIITFSVLAILFPAGVLVGEGCEWMDDMMKNKTEFLDPGYKFLPRDSMR